MVVALLMGSGCSLPVIGERPLSLAITDTQETTLARAIRDLSVDHPGKSGVYALQVPHDAFAARGLLAAAAERSIDVQYYIWQGDTTGYLLFELLWLAAERGIRVRLLLDDNNTKGLDATLAALDSHPNIDVRLYNPLTQRALRSINYLTNPRRMNRRMHNKSFTFDNQATIVGGRNIGDEYFGAGDGIAFDDLDVLAVGPIVSEVSAAFDRYWNSASAYALADLIDPATPKGVTNLHDTFARARQDPHASTYLMSLRQTPLVSELTTGRLAFEWTDVLLLCDDPGKTLATDDHEDLLMLPRMLEAAGRPNQQLDLVSPYFVPGKQGTDSLAALAAGIRVRILTNSLESTDVGAVHAGYVKRRKPLLRAGVQLYEFKRSEAAPAPRKSSSGSSAASLHAKTFVVDRRRVFIGSFNFDPRSARLNTEMGFIFDSPTLGHALDQAFAKDIPRRAYEVRLAEAGNSVIWIEHTADSEQRYDNEPRTSWLRRFGVAFMSILPIEPLL
jgi:putative cardiolipin synthase